MATVKGILKGHFSVENTTRNHTWIVDEPIELGGEDLGPKPTESLLSALISCKIITVKMYAERKDWDVKNITIELAIAEKLEDKTVIDKRIQIEGDLDEKQIERLIDISGRCPVVKMLSNSLEFRIIE